MSVPKLILASASDRRRELLKQIGILPDKIESADIDETQLKNENNRQYVERIAKDKAVFVAKKFNDSFVIAADTIVICGRKILHKAENNEQIASYLAILSGRQHSVLTSIYIIAPGGKTASKTVSTKVKFKKLTKHEIQGYVSDGDGVGKAGGYAIQGLAGSFVKSINGSYSSVVGLPLYEVKNSLYGVGYE